MKRILQPDICQQTEAGGYCLKLLLAILMHMSCQATKNILTDQSTAGTIQRSTLLTIKTADGSAELLNQELSVKETRQVSGSALTITDECAWR